MATNGFRWMRRRKSNAALDSSRGAAFLGEIGESAVALVMRGAEGAGSGDWAKSMLLCCLWQALSADVSLRPGKHDEEEGWQWSLKLGDDVEVSTAW